MGQINRRPSVLRSKYFFFIISYRLRALKTLYFHFCNFIKNKRNKLKGFFAKNFARFYEKKNHFEHQMLGRRVLCPIGPTNQHIILSIDRFLFSVLLLILETLYVNFPKSHIRKRASLSNL